MKNIISNSEITVVIQGPFYFDQNNAEDVNVLACMKSIMAALPGSKIIVSTWEHERCYHEQISFLAGRIVYSPLPVTILSYGNENNVTHQIALTKAGLAFVDTPYALKIGANILVQEKTEFFSDPEDRLNVFALVDDPVKKFMLFVFPDFIQFGKIEWMRCLWEAEIPSGDWYLEKYPQSIFDIYRFPCTYKFSFKQNLGISWARNKHKASPLIRHQFDINYSDFLYWKDILARDFNFYRVNRSGFLFNPQRHGEGNFIDAEGVWLRTSSRRQFFRLLINKYVLFVFNKEWWKQFAKYARYNFSKYVW